MYELVSAARSMLVVRFAILGWCVLQTKTLQLNVTKTKGTGGAPEENRVSSDLCFNLAGQCGHSGGLQISGSPQRQ